MSEILPLDFPRLKFHPLVNMLPPVDALSREALVKSLIEEGQRKPIVVHHGKILDGRARYELLTALGRPVTARSFARCEKAALIWTLYVNAPRLSAKQKRLVLQKITVLLTDVREAELLKSLMGKYGVLT